LAEHENDATVDFDLDEDLFNFDEVMPDTSGQSADDIDLDEIFAAFQEDGDEVLPQEEPELEEDDPFRPAPAASVTSGASAPDEDEDEDEDLLDLDLDEDEVAVQPAPARTAKPRKAGAAAARAQGRDDEEDDDLDEAAARPRVRRTRRRRRERGATTHAVTFLTKGAVVVLIAMTLLNVSIAFVTFSSATGMRSDLEAASRQMADAALEIRDKVGEQTDAVRHQFLPIAPPTLDAHPTFDRAVADIEVGDHAEARRRIYALLAVVDRQPVDLREDLEARAEFLLARSYHAEAAAIAGSGGEEKR
jgi:hypothetical protein